VKISAGLENVDNGFYFTCSKKNLYLSLSFCQVAYGVVCAGCFCIYSDSASLEYIRCSLETTLVANLEKEDRLLPLVILFQPPPNTGDKELLFLQSEGSSRLLCVSHGKHQ
jgi:hypothetical protein